MNALVEVNQSSVVAQTRLSVSEMIDHVRAVQEVMRSVMKQEVHYGLIPGTDKPTLLKPGAEVLCVAFRIADRYEVEDLSTPDAVRYRITCYGEHQATGITLGSGLGECSSDEEKYKWRKAVCTAEFDETPESMRRIKHAKGKGGSVYTVAQIRMQPSDVANTILKMANKRAKIAMVLNVTGASDMFSQDLEDLDELLREHLTEDSRHVFIEEKRAEFAKMAKDTTTDVELKKVMKQAVKHFNDIKDSEGYKQFSEIVQTHGKTVKRTEGAA